MDRRHLISGTAMTSLLVLATGSTPLIDNYNAMNYRATRAEVPDYVDGIKTAELAYDAAFDEFVPVPDPVPRPIAALDRSQESWVYETAFDTLGWAPDGMVRGTYWVEVLDDGMDYRVHGMIDSDNDGIPAHYTATKSTNATLVTPQDVF